MQIDAQSEILWDFEFFEKCGSSNFRKIWAIVLKFHTNIIHRSRTFGIIYGQNRLERSNFLRFWICWKFSLNCVTCANFELLSSKYLYECTNTNGVSYEIWWQLVEAFNFYTHLIFLFSYRDFKFKNFDVSMKWGSQNQGIYFPKEKTLSNRRGSNMEIPIPILFLYTFEFFQNNLIFLKIPFLIKIQSYIPEIVSSVPRKILDLDMESCYKNISNS